MVNIQYDSTIDLHYRSDGHRHLNIPVFYNTNENNNNSIDFILDTGAYVTVLTKRTAELFGFDRLIPLAKNLPLTGFAGYKVEGDLIEIPILLGGKRLEAKVVVPYVHIENNILGLNVLEHFNYSIDNTNDKIHFSSNANYKANNTLMCSNIWSVSDKT